MSQSWSDLLMNDHQTTEKVLEAVERAFAAPGGPPVALLRDAMEYFQGYVDACHNKKEEDHLFPLIERRGIPRAGGPLAVMLSEHDQNRLLLPALALLANAYITGDRGTLEDLRAAFDQYSSLLKNHFWKENDILYPMARRVMSEADAQAVVAGIDATEAAIGPGTRERFYALAERISTQEGSKTCRSASSGTCWRRF
jgi:hemerythrin-like domain-containing protein